MIPSLEILQGARLISPLDRHFALGLSRIADESNAKVVLAAALASRQVAAGHVCLDFARPDDFALRESLPTGMAWPAPDEWLAALRTSDLVECIGAAEKSTAREPTPLVLDAGDRLYLRRYWAHQLFLAEDLRRRAQVELPAIDEARLQHGLDRFFGPARESHDPQREAAALAVLRGFAVITGGPGTGKTSTVAKILALGIEQTRAAGRTTPRITLVAPTGKAAARLSESITEGLERLDIEAEVRGSIPTATSTIHRTLGSRIGTKGRYRHHAKNPLPTDWLIVDEASMVDLALMCRLVAALPRDARLILLGDEFQLASVEAGAVLGDICDAGNSSARSPAFSQRLARVAGPADATTRESGVGSVPGICDCIARLRASHRYQEGSGIDALTRAVRNGDYDAALAILDDPSMPDVRRCDPAPGGGLPPALLEEVVGEFEKPVDESEIESRLAAFSSLRLLAVHRRGPGGVESLNGQVVAALRRTGRVEGFEANAFSGCPILITRNDYELELFNGDTGMLWALDDGKLSAFFPEPGSAPRRIARTRLPAHETAFAMTVHKSQGSEFERVVIVVPERTSAVLSRELLYTAISRARREVLLVASRAAISAGIERRIDRASGLRELLWR